MENARAESILNSSRYLRDKRETRKLRRLLFWGVAAYAVAVGLVVWFAMGVM